jgi:threonine aldolase
VTEPHTRQFASDNYAGMCPEALEALADANRDHCPAYGEDRWTARAADAIRELFACDCEVFFVFNGTAANSLSLAAICQSYHSIICHEHAHIETDECGSPEFFSNGAKLLLGGGPRAKLTPESIRHIASRRTDIHYPRPQALSITQTTELGAVYTPAEITALCDAAREFGLRTHMDGARFANAVAALEVSPGEASRRCGIDVLCFGIVKNGAAFGEAVIFFDRALARDFAYRCKQGGQLASKMRFMSAPWLGLLANGVWLDNARRANRCARLLAETLRSVAHIEPVWPVEANALFVRMSRAAQQALHDRGWRFYRFPAIDCVRLMCSWNTDTRAIEQFAADAADCRDR